MGEQQKRVWATTIRLPREMSIADAGTIVEKIRELGTPKLIGNLPDVVIHATIEEETLAAYSDADVHDYSDYDVRVGYDLAFVVDEWESYFDSIGFSEVDIPRPELVAA